MKQNEKGFYDRAEIASQDVGNFSNWFKWCLSNRTIYFFINVMLGIIQAFDARSMSLR